MVSSLLRNTKFGLVALFCPIFNIINPNDFILCRYYEIFSPLFSRQASLQKSNSREDSVKCKDIF